MVYINVGIFETHEKLWAAIREIEGGPDRSTALVGGSFVESALSKALISHMHHDKKITEELFRPTGALGTFATKIRMGKLTGLYGDAALKDLNIIKDIRNDFAHKPEVNSFDLQQMKARTSNFKFIDRYTTSLETPLEEVTKGTPMKDWPMWFSDIHWEHKISSSRGRFILSVQLFIYALSSFHESRMPNPKF